MWTRMGDLSTFRIQANSIRLNAGWVSNHMCLSGVSMIYYAFDWVDKDLKDHLMMFLLKFL